jgi:hypothetical protein
MEKTMILLNRNPIRWLAWTGVAIVYLTASVAGVQAKSPTVSGQKYHRWYDPRRYVERCAKTAGDLSHLEIVEMLWVLAHGQPPDDGKGWFHGGQSRYGWAWLADRYDHNGDGTISAEEFPSDASELLARLDRDQDGKINKDDFDWSSTSPYVKQASQARRLFSFVDRDRNGHVNKEEWISFFDRTALDADSITPADLQKALFPPQPSSSGDDPTPVDFLRGFVSGELGSIHEGPRIGQRAPDFDLPDHYRERRLRLSQYRDKKPVVLIFGSFT